MWYKFANQFGEPTPFIPEDERELGSNEKEALTDKVDAMPALTQRIEELSNPKKDPYKKTLEGQLEHLHQENMNELDPNSAQPDALWRGLDVANQSKATSPNKNWPAAMSNVQV